MPQILSQWLRHSGVLVLLSGALAEPVVLQTSAQTSVSPKFILGDGPPSGECPDILHAIEQLDSGLRFEGLHLAHSTPLIVQGLESGRFDVFCGLLKLPQRQNKMQYLDPPIYQVEHRVLARRADAVPVRDLADLRQKSRQKPVIATAGQAISQQLLDEGIRIDAASDNRANLRRLQSGRGDYFYGSNEVLIALVQTEQAQHWAKIMPTVFRIEPMYLVTRKRLDPAIVYRLSQALTELAKRGELERIHQKWRPASLD